MTAFGWFFIIVIIIIGLGIAAGYYDWFADEWVTIKGKKLRLTHYFDKFVIEKYYWPGFWKKLKDREFIVPLYVYEITPDMKTYKYNSGKKYHRTTILPDTTDKEKAEQEFERINSYTNEQKYNDYEFHKKYDNIGTISQEETTEETKEPQESPNKKYKNSKKNKK